MSKVFFYLSSLLNILNFEKPLKKKPENWIGPFTTKRDAEDFKEKVKRNRDKKKERWSV